MAWKADVIIPIEGAHSTILRSVRSILDHGGTVLRSLLVIDDGSPDHHLAEALRQLARADSRIHFVRSPRNSGWVESCNLGLRERKGDCVLLHGDTLVTDRWLSELAAVAHFEERTASATPLSSERGSVSTLSWNREAPAPFIDEATIRAACSALPRWTTVPRSEGPCIYLRGDVLDAVGLLDPSLGNRALALDDWTMRAQALGFVAKRANHAFVSRIDRAAEQDDVTDARSDQQDVLNARYSHLQHQVSRFRRTLDGSMAAHAIQFQSTGKLRVALDLRHLAEQQVGTRTYAISLGRALSELPEIDLTLLVTCPSQGDGLKGRLVTPDRWTDDVAIIHKPAQVFDQRHLGLLFESSAHVVITYQDLIAHRIPLVFPNDVDFDQYRSTNSLSLQATQRILAYSESTAREIAEEFGIPRAEISVAPLGVDVSVFARRDPHDEAIRVSLGLPERYFFTLATDYPHKNLSALLEAYSLVRKRWKVGKPPALIFAGHTVTPRTAHNSDMKSQQVMDGARFLGPVSAEELRVLYQHAVALIFPSLYEGFGLPPLEAMAAGTPVIAMPFSSIPEVGGDCVLYPDGLSVKDLARAMERLAKDDDLRHELRSRGFSRAEHQTWERTARATLEVYRSVVLRPTQRSLQMRRALRDAIIHWSESSESSSPMAPVVAAPEPLGIRHACLALNHAVHRRLHRELGRLPMSHKRKRA